MEVLNKLKSLSDREYAIFQAKLTPNVDKDKFIGVRVPVLRNFAKEYSKTNEAKEFINTLPHKTYDENMLHGILISLKKDYDEVIYDLEKFLPYVDNWAVCDIMSPKILAKKKEQTLQKIKEWASDKKIYTIRFGIEMLMSFYLDDDFKMEYLEIPLLASNDDYYVKMMVAWFYATALAKQWKDTICYLENNKLNVWEHNKTIQKACESYRITDEQKQYLRSLKR